MARQYMDEYVTIAKKSEIPSSGAKVVNVQGRELAVFNIDGEFFALDNLCLHRGGPLGEGELEGSVVECPWHGWQYDVTTGKNGLDPAMEVQKFEVRVEGDEIQVAL